MQESIMVAISTNSAYCEVHMGYKEMCYHHLYSSKIAEGCVLLADRIFFGYSFYRITIPSAVTKLGSRASLSLSRA